MNPKTDNSAPRGRGLTWAVLLGVAWLTMVIAGVVVEKATGHPVQMCMFKRLTGLPCATCGSTRAMLALAHGEPARAFTLNPMVCVLLAIAPVWLLLRWRRTRTGGQAAAWSSSWRIIAWAAATGLFFANWAYVIWRGN